MNVAGASRAETTSDNAPLTQPRALLKPLLSPAGFNDPSVQALLDAQGPDALVALLAQHGLAPMWFEAIAADSTTPPGLRALLPILKVHRTRAIITGQLQRAVAIEVQQALTAVGIDSVVFKGAHLGNTLYSDAGLRPSADVDLLVAKADRRRAIQCFDELGAEFHPNSNTVCYQTAVTFKQVEIDLHWGFVRPGRTRTEVGNILLQHTEQVRGLRVPNALGTLLALLIHPLASTRPNAADAKLIRLVDLAHWLDVHEPDWDAVTPALELTGARHTAWLMLTWLSELTETAYPIPAALTPPPRKQRQLKRGLLAAPAAHKWLTPLWIQLVYRPALHSSLSDTLRELAQLARAKLHARHDLAELRALLRHQ